MAGLKLTKGDLAALDLLIGSLQDDQAGDAAVVLSDAEAARFITAVARVTARVVRATPRATPAIRLAARVTPGIIGGASFASEESLSTLETAEAELDNLSLGDLIELRNKIQEQQKTELQRKLGDID